MTATCTICKETKSKSEFWPDRSHKNGVTSRCKECARQYLRAYNKSPERRKYNRERAVEARQRSWKALAGNRDAATRYYWNHRNEILKKLKEKRRSDDIKARNYLNWAVKTKRIIRSEFCDKCGKQGDTEAHHHLGYAEKHWLDVQWLCPACHGKTRRIS